MLHTNRELIAQSHRCHNVSDDFCFVREDASAEMKCLQEQGIVEPMDLSPWISNLVGVSRKSGVIRLCVDHKAIYKDIILDKYLLPTIEELSAVFYHSTVFTKLDMCQSHLHIWMAKGSKYLTAFLPMTELFSIG